MCLFSPVLLVALCYIHDRGDSLRLSHNYYFHYVCTTNISASSNMFHIRVVVVLHIHKNKKKSTSSITCTNYFYKLYLPSNVTINHI